MGTSSNFTVVAALCRSSFYWCAKKKLCILKNAKM